MPFLVPAYSATANPSKTDYPYDFPALQKCVTADINAPIRSRNEMSQFGGENVRDAKGDTLLEEPLTKEV